MGIKFSESDAKIILRARAVVKQRNIAGIVSMVIMLAGFIALYFGKLEAKDFGVLSMAIGFFAAAGFPLVRKTPNHNQLLEFIENKISENPEAIITINNLKQK